MIGTSPRSSNNSIANAPRPTAPVVPASGNTSAVEDSASASPSPIAPGQSCPSTCSPTPMITADPSSSAAPVPNTWLRIVHSRRKLSSSPMVNSSRMIPNSANGSIASRFEMVK